MSYGTSEMNRAIFIDITDVNTNTLALDTKSIKHPTIQ